MCYSNNMKLKTLENKQKKDIKKLLLQIFVVATVALIGGMAFRNFFEESGIIPTGLSGFAMVICKLLAMIGLNIPTAVVYLIMNLILLAFAFRIMGWRFLLLTGVGIGFYTLAMQFLAIPALIEAASADKLLSCFVGASVTGLTIGVAIKFGGSTGGSDIMAVIINRYFPKIKTGYCLLIINAIVLTLSVIVGGLSTGLYALVVSVVNSVATNMVLDGSKRVMSFYIICDKDEEVADAILQRFHRGVTRLEAVGMFSKKNKAVLLCLVPNENAREMKKIVHSVDEEAFVFSAPVTETMGDGNFMKEMSQFKNKVRKAERNLKNHVKYSRHANIKALKMKKKQKRFFISEKKEQ